MDGPPDYWKGAAPPERAVACQDPECPCTPDARLAPGEGWLYVDRRTADAMQRRVPPFDRPGGSDPAFGPWLVCAEAAGRRKLALDEARTDAERWWHTGEVPLRPTPVDAGTVEQAGREVMRAVFKPAAIVIALLPILLLLLAIYMLFID